MSAVYYWIKLHTDFFKRQDIRIVEDLENGEKYLLFYIKLLLESAADNGALRLNNAIPYDEKMLAAVTGTDRDIVRSALQIFKELGAIEILNDGALYMKQLALMVGHETAYAEKKRKQRQDKQLQGGQSQDNGKTKKGQKRDNVRQEIRDKSIEIRDNINTSEGDNVPSVVPFVPATPGANALEESSPLYRSIWDSFMSKTKAFANYGKEGKATKQLVKIFESREDPESEAKAALEKFYELTQGQDKFWSSQPFTPSVLLSLLDRVQVAVNKAKDDDDFSAAWVDEILGGQ